MSNLVKFTTRAPDRYNLINAQVKLIEVMVSYNIACSKGEISERMQKPIDEMILATTKWIDTEKQIAFTKRDLDGNIIT